MSGAVSEQVEEGSAEARREAASALIESHDAVFRRTARRYSICAEDADDAYQRALEILLTKAPPIDRESLVRWMQTVTKHEALAVRRQRERLLGPPRAPAGEDERDPLDSVASERPGPTDRAESRERVARSSEALRALKPQEVTALTLKAEGYSYAEIGELTGWTYTKINRCMAEGRKRFLSMFDDIEHGRRCEALAVTLSAFADGEADEAAAEDVRAHLRSCGSCRARLRDFRGVPDRVLELAPIGPALDQTIGGRAHEWLGERLGAAADKIRETGFAVIARGGDSHAQLAGAGAGGTRGAGMAALGKVLAVCGATAAGGAACVATGVVDTDAVGLGAEDPKPAVERPERPVEEPVDQQEVVAPPTDAPAAGGSEEPAPAELTPAQQANKQFGFEGAASSQQSAPGGGSGGEFGAPAGGGGGGSSGGSGRGFGFEK